MSVAQQQLTGPVEEETSSPANHDSACELYYQECKKNSQMTVFIRAKHYLLQHLRNMHMNEFFVQLASISIDSLPVPNWIFDASSHLTSRNPELTDEQRLVRAWISYMESDALLLIIAINDPPDDYHDETSLSFFSIEYTIEDAIEQFAGDDTNPLYHPLTFLSPDEDEIIWSAIQNLDIQIIDDDGDYHFEQPKLEHCQLVTDYMNERLSSSELIQQVEHYKIHCMIDEVPFVFSS
jgi:hypothetical protein